MNREEIKNRIKESGLMHWQVAMQVGVAECTLTRWLRGNLDGDVDLRYAAKIIVAIEQLKAKK